jgi:asparagine synthetase B (glutamine-hydrolysing)
MCGIHVNISKTAPRPLSSDLKSRLCSRGPDHFGQYETRLESSEESPKPAEISLSFTSTVLSLRGDHITQQPFVDPSGSVLCWNGEAWRIDGIPVQGNDGEALFKRLTEAPVNCARSVLSLLQAIEGPFSFIYYSHSERRIYYGRDRLGRRSLLVKDDEGLTISSVADDMTSSWKEVEADGLYTLDVKDVPQTGRYRHDASMRYDWLPAGGEYQVGFHIAPQNVECVLLLTASGFQYWQLQHGPAVHRAPADAGICFRTRAPPSTNRVAETSCLECSEATRSARRQ